MIWQRLRGLVMAGAAFVLCGQAVAVAAQISQPEPLEPPPPDLPSVSDYSLPPGDEPEPAEEPAQGPAADEVPPPEPLEPATETPAQPASPLPVLPVPESLPQSAPATDADSPAPEQVAPVAPPATTRPAAPESPVSTDESGPAPGFSFDTDPTELPADTQQPAPAGAAPGPTPETETSSTYLLIGAGLLLLLAALVAALIWRRKSQSRADSAERFIPTEPVDPESRATLPEPDLDHLLDPLSDTQGRGSTAEPPAEPDAQPVVRNFGSARPQRWGHLKIEFVAESASSTLINALVSYRIILTNEGGDNLSNLAVSGAMAQAEKDIAVSDLGLVHTPLHELPSLAAGQSVTLQGELRLPLTAIRPIAFKSQALFIPLARFAVEYLDGDGEKQRQVAAFVVGREYDPPRQKMAPFRLDLGPGSFAPVGQRALVT
ncbi:hypothetical protein SAMN02745824_1239 [Parasphingorhabdus marina DSM 22363]|uniref:LPXTG-motif cell wall anchor domain-containing protein n=2 Tax=Parasphingorhabdus marina TaxID=394732 RepID=A0A1N6CYF7_9SPHN|nr:hypothetical protein SAMN02745824_1239 [Parasphingorhabdus marina DSM 22363]